MNLEPAQFSRVRPLLEKTAADSHHWSKDAMERPMTISFLNQHGVNTAVHNTSFFNFLMGSDYLLRDGIGAKLALKLFGLSETENLNGTDLITQIVLGNRSRSVGIFGTSDAVLAVCRKNLEQDGVANIAALAHGFHADEVYLNICKSLQPETVILCMGMPRQELLAAKLKKNGFGGMVICGGGWADFYSGVKTRAPEWMRQLSLEWLHRLMREPKRLGKRYTVDILYYFYVLLRARMEKA